MVITRDVKALKQEIEKLIESRYFYIKLLSEDFFNKFDHLLFKEQKIHINDNQLKAYDVNLKGEEIYVLDSHLLMYDGAIITILKFNSNFQFKKIRDLKSHLLLFYIRTNSINKKTRFVIYNMVLSLVSQKIRMLDDFLEKILVFLNVEHIEDIFIKEDLLYCVYDNLNVKVYNTKLLEVGSELLEDEAPKEENKYIFEDLIITILEDKLEIDFVKKNFVDIIEIPGIKQVFGVDNNLFILTKLNIKILTFSAER